MKLTINWSKLSLTIFLMVILINLIYLDYRQVFKVELTQLPSVKPDIIVLSSPQLRANETDQILKEDLITDQEQKFLLNLHSATASLTQRLDTLEKNLLPTSSKTIPTTVKTTNVKEYYIPLGSGSSKDSNWIDLPGIEAYLTPKNYGIIKEMYFEAGLNNPTGNGRVYARLRNVTDNTPLIESEVSREGIGGGSVVSGRIPLPNTTKLYRVQLKSSLGALVSLDSGRIKIIVE